MELWPDVEVCRMRLAAAACCWLSPVDNGTNRQIPLWLQLRCE